jgi:hypothetical protein
MARKSDSITEHAIWKLIVSGLKESSFGGMRLKNGCGCQGDETIMIRANSRDVFWIHISQLDEEFAEDAIAEWDETPDL